MDVWGYGERIDAASCNAGAYMDIYDYWSDRPGVRDSDGRVAVARLSSVPLPRLAGLGALALRHRAARGRG